MIRDIDRRIARALSGVRQSFRAVVAKVDTSTPVGSVQGVGVSGEVLQDHELFQQYGFSSNPPPGSMMIVLPMGGKTAHGIVIATEHGEYRVKNLVSGEVAIFTDEGDSIILKRGRLIEVTTDVLQVMATTKVEFITPLVQVTGGDIKADDISVKHHKHGNVAAGTADTGEAVV